MAEGNGSDLGDEEVQPDINSDGNTEMRVLMLPEKDYRILEAVGAFQGIKYKSFEKDGVYKVYLPGNAATRFMMKLIQLQQSAVIGWYSFSKLARISSFVIDVS